MEQEVIDELTLLLALETQPLLDVSKQPPRFRQPGNPLEIFDAQVGARQAHVVRAANLNDRLIERGNSRRVIRIVVQQPDRHVSMPRENHQRIS